MSVQEGYLKSDFHQDQRELERIHAVTKRVGEMFVKLVVKDQWPYEVKANSKIERGKDYSQSTNAMILFALRAAVGQIARNCPLVPASPRVREVELSADISKRFQEVWSRLIEETASYVERTRFQDDTKAAHLSWSGSFGWDDPFTMAWLFELCRSEDSSSGGSNVKKVEETLRLREEELLRKASGFCSGAREPNAEKLLTWKIDPRVPETAQRELREQKKDREHNASLDHAFPVLRYLHLLVGLRQVDEKWDSSQRSAFRNYMEGRLHSQLSDYEIPDSGFDASELVFALEGLLLLDAKSVSRALIDRVFRVISESQNRNSYWRASKPFVTTPQGHVLFPLSVETANSLLRCCALIAKEHNDEWCFSRNLVLFKTYTEWLLARRKQGTALKEDELVNFEGWHSEHVHLHEGIHLWETSQVLLFLSDYATMLDSHIARSSLAAANLTLIQPWKQTQEEWHLEYWAEENRQVGEPLAGFAKQSQFRTFRLAGEHFIAPRPNPAKNSGSPKAGEVKSKLYSMLIYGPPGTGKTSLAEEICRALKWPLITVTPSDFIRGGESQVEERAKMLFEVLGAQKDAVILFDEIDRMILDRDSPDYTKQGDIFQFMTPSMLTKLRDLRKRERVIFLIATNYFDRIDAAARRRGRIDLNSLMSPPDLEGRLTIFKKLLLDLRRKQLKSSIPSDKAINESWIGEGLKKHLSSLNAEHAEGLRQIAKETRFKVFGELKEIFDDAIDDLDKSEKTDLGKIIPKILETARDAEPAAISLKSYQGRFKSDSQKPFEEFLVLLHLSLEEGGKIGNEKKLVDDVLRLLLEVDQKAWDSMDADKRKNSLEPHLPKVLGGDSELVRGMLDNYPF